MMSKKNEWDLETALKDHGRWLGGGAEGSRLIAPRNANLSNANLSNADLSYTDLSNANLSNANLSNANLSNANLRYTDLSDANLPTWHRWFLSWTTAGSVSIGCQTKSISRWDIWFAGNDEYETKRNSSDFMRIEAAYQHAKRMYEIYAIENNIALDNQANLC